MDCLTQVTGLLVELLFLISNRTPRLPALSMSVALQSPMTAEGAMLADRVFKTINRNAALLVEEVEL